jgi:hypothetical protein
MPHRGGFVESLPDLLLGARTSAAYYTGERSEARSAVDSKGTIYTGEVFAGRTRAAFLAVR